VINFLKKIREKKASSVCNGPQGKKGWRSEWHKNRSGGSAYQVMFFGFILFILMAFVYKINIVKLPADLLDSLSSSETTTTAVAPTDTVAPTTDTTAISTDTTASTDTTSVSTNITVPTDTITSSATTTTSIDVAAPTDSVVPLAETTTPSTEEITVPATLAPTQPNVEQNIPVGQNAPVVTKVISPILSGTFKSGVVPIMVLFDKPVVVSGDPQLIISTGNPATTAVDYKFGFKKLLLFLYHISPGNYSSRLDYISSSALVLNGGEIKDESGNEADLTLPQPGSMGSLSNYSNIVIDAPE